jgi:biotin transport system substrate-specific component
MVSTIMPAQEYSKEHPAFITTQIFLSSLLIAFCAQISLPLPFSPVPLSLQTFAVMMVGGMLGSRKGTISVLLYLAESMLGMPVLAGGLADPLALIGPKGGYLMGFVFQAYIAGWFAERIHTFGKSGLMISLFAAYALVLVTGTLWLSQFVGLSNAFVMGTLPFIPGAIAKILAAVSLLTRKGY